MDDNRQIGLHDMGIPYPYSVSDGFGDYFGVETSAIPLQYVHTVPMHDQVSAYWSMPMHSYRFASSDSESTSFYGFCEDIGHSSRMEYGGRAWEYPSMTNVEEPIAVDVLSHHNTGSVVHSILEKASPDHQDAVNTQDMWQDDIDPDNMTYEELLDLSETIGTESRGLSQELINLLPTSKYKSGGIFSRRKSEDSCVICQMRYKRGDRQMHLPCKHVYHVDCGTRWLSINKTCPVCTTEVFGGE